MFLIADGFLQDSFLLVLFLVLLGGCAGFLAGLLGVGGGIVLVPGLYIIFQSLQDRFDLEDAILMHVCVGTSLAIIMPTGLSSALAHHRKHCVDFVLAGRLGVGVVAGVFTGVWIAGGLSGDAMKMIFSIALIILAVIMAVNPARFRGNTARKHPQRFFASMAGIVIGGVSALVGIGGATLSVPYMSLHGVAMRRAVGTASALGLIISVPAALGYMWLGLNVEGLPPVSFGYVNLLAWACIVPLSVFVAPFGASVAHKIEVSLLRKIFASFMLVVALNMWRQVLV